MSSGPESAGVDHINAHGREHFGGILECGWTDAKGRIVHATRSWQQGEVILVESPLHIVQEDVSNKAFRKLQKMCKNNKFDYEPLWYWCALKSLTKEQLEGAYEGGWDPATPLQQKNLLLLHHEVTDAGRESCMMVEELVPNCDPMILERLTQVWVLNCFEYSDHPTGYSVYFFSSFMSHSCYPNAVWHYTGSDHVLRARRNIKVGDEVCIAYLPEDGLLNPTVMRRYELHQTKHFWCDCERCDATEDATRGVYCPKCSKGTVFSAAFDSENTRKEYLPKVWISRKCNSCGHIVTQDEAQSIALNENKLKKLIDNGFEKNGATLADVSKSERWIEATFSQHFLADSAWEQLADIYAKHGEYAEQRRVLQQRCSFHDAAYPGLSGTHAWSLEALGDVLGQAFPLESAAAAKKRARNTGTAVLADKGKAEEKYTKSLEILRLMFGEDHEYVVTVADKLKALREDAEAA
jgi:hypothetical protein